MTDRDDGTSLTFFQTQEYWGLVSLSKLGSMLGIPIKIDKYTKDKSFLKYARLLIESQLEDNFPEYIEFVNEHNVVVWQRVEYEWKPTKCDFCKMHGHTREDYRKKPQPRTKRRLVVRKESQELAPPQPHTDEDGFITVRKKATATATGSKGLPTAASTVSTPVLNTFEMLVAKEGTEVMHSRTKGGPPLWTGYAVGI
ncbi:hypothetical protein Cgig2_001537 [Carnegiea gigantea]|uniref:Uncharacterized protein n=1 Tax=Carnegiea gigantea TaxID=171969 RepID=A0A9Q1GUY1_9CARY|nr:hypothetical protein Cgig2_001537 [Carnegiea gigantea]